MTDSPPQKLETYLFRYQCDGHTYCLNIPAHSEREARMRVAAISDTATYDGVLQMKIPGGPDPFTTSLFLTLICRVRNLVRRLLVP